MQKIVSSLRLVVCIVLFLPANLLYAQEADVDEGDLDELLDLSIEELTNLSVTTPTKTPQKLSETPATVRVITAKEIKERGYFTLEEALSDLPGIQFRNILGFNSYVFMRGVPNQNNLIIVMVDGIQINELNSGGFYGGGQYNLSNVERIEVVYGPASALYGTHAVSGIINIITKDPKDIRGIRVSVLAGNFDTRNYDFTSAYYNEKHDLGLSLSGMFKESNKADLRGARGDYNWSNSMDNFEEDFAFDGKLQYKKLTLGFVFQDKKASRATKFRTLDTSLRDNGTHWHIRFLNIYAKYTYDKSENWSWHSQVYYRDATVEDDTLPTIRMASFEDRGYQERWYRPNHLLGLENQLNWNIGRRLALTLGLVFERESLAEGFSKSRSSFAIQRSPKPDKPHMLSDLLISVYAQVQYKLADPLSLTLGVRYDDSDVYGTVVTPRIALVFNKDKLTVKLLYAEAYRAPRPWDYTDGVGNDGLAPEEMQSLEFFAAYSFTDHLRFDVALYRNVLDEILSKEATAASWRWVNSGTVETLGFEGNLEYRKGKVKSYLNYTYNDSSYADGNAVPEIAKHTANIGVNYALTKHMALNLRGQYLGKRKNTHVIPSTGSDSIDDAFVLHGTLSFLNMRNVDFQIAVKNILNAKYYHTSNTTVSRYRQPQRTITARVEYKF